MANFDGSRRHALGSERAKKAKTRKGNAYHVVEGTLDSRVGRTEHTQKVESAARSQSVGSDPKRVAAAKKAAATRRARGGR